MASPRGARRSARLVVTLTATVVALALLAGPLVLERTASATASPGVSAPASGAFRYIYVDWNGASHNISSAGTPAKAFSFKPGETGHANFTFVFSGGTVPTGTSAQLQLTYLGLVLTTSNAAVVPSILVPGKGTAEVNFSFGPLYDAIEGAFRVTASLVASSGGSYWSQSFYLFVKAPYLLESAAVIVLLILLIVEAFQIALALREARRPPPPGTPAPPSPAPGSTTAPVGPAGTESGSGGSGPLPPPPAGPGGAP